MKHILLCLMVWSSVTMALPVALFDRLDRAYDTLWTKTLSVLPAEQAVAMIDRIQTMIDRALTHKKVDTVTREAVQYFAHHLCVTVTTLNGVPCEDGYRSGQTYTRADTLTLDRLRQDFLAEHNRRLLERGLTRLTQSSILDQIAQNYVKKLCERGEITHELDGSTLAERYADGGYQAVWYGENIGMGQPHIADLMDQFTISPLHRINIYNKNFTEVGLGYCDDIWVVNYGAPL